VHLAQGVADETRGAIERGHREQAVRPGRKLLHELLVEDADHRLGDGEVAGRAQQDHPLPRLAPIVELAEGGDIVAAGAGARVGGEHQPAIEPHGNAIGHPAILPMGLVSGSRIRD
jgi:hypothetical protein